MKTLKISLLFGILGAILAGCTHNNGDIGNWFGTWRLEKLTADGTALPIYDAPGVVVYTWKFQSNVILIEEVLEHQDVRPSYGTWKEHDDVLEVNFDYHDNASNIDFYTPPAALHLRREATSLTIIKSTRSEVVLSYVNPSDGVEYTYYLKRAY